MPKLFHCCRLWIRLNSRCSRTEPAATASDIEAGQALEAIAQAKRRRGTEIYEITSLEEPLSQALIDRDGKDQERPCKHSLLSFHP